MRDRSKPISATDPRPVMVELIFGLSARETEEGVKAELYLCVMAGGGGGRGGRYFSPAVVKKKRAGRLRW